MRTDAQRKAAYEARMLSTLLDPTGAAVVAKAVANYNAYADDFVPKQLQLRVLLDATHLGTDMYAGYEAFFGELYHLSKVCSGTALAHNAYILVGKWADPSKMGPASAALMAAIALDIFTCTIAL